MFTASYKVHRDPRVWSVIVALGSNGRVVTFRAGNREIPIYTALGDAVLFRGDVSHFGGASAMLYQRKRLKAHHERAPWQRPMSQCLAHEITEDGYVLPVNVR